MNVQFTPQVIGAQPVPPVVLEVRRQAREQAAAIAAANRRADEVVARLHECSRTDPDPECRSYADALVYQLNKQTAHLHGVRYLNLTDEEVLCWLHNTIQEAEDFLDEDGWLLELLELA